MPEQITLALRRAAADLATMAPADRDWLLERLSAAERARLRAALGPARFDDSLKTQAPPGDLPETKTSLDHAAINATSAATSAATSTATSTARSTARRRVLGELASSPSDGWLLARVVAALPATERALAAQHPLIHRAEKHTGTTVAPSLVDTALLDVIDELGATLPDHVAPPDRPASMLHRLLRKVNG